ncbi:gamma-D-glutamyl-{L}-meso-diaminopimelate peptidase I Metallo peptidase. MEROPS family M14C [Alteribacillus persepolensis]|uniref:Gamma-D-glutamyl-(L)-meso-diaminopimelate peptidase I Metallo peptidase. MEROPS family M14C n=1 Tax=Alteribacillus persepolensis TaxID=568899 RepID=A0A1G7ZJU4_9BACI|nr:M14 family metallopeptidase [Alteribacillus persepolensis]SDH08944.1 gamma-D-glutamyl-{L}-meso-diaminopimelate peptidase I Metallo peptidase. MEROPS family M14C [Alteribacillus persepolensis]
MVSYQVKPGDTLAKVAYHNKVRTEDLLACNRDLLSAQDYIKPGAFLQIPDPGPGDIMLDKIRCCYEYGFRELEEDKQQLTAFTCETIGQSRMGKPLWLFKAGDGPYKIFLSATWHGNEWLNTWLLMEFLKTLQQKIQQKESWRGLNIENVLQETSIYAVPLVNPDGAELVQEGLYDGHPYYDEINKINYGYQQFHHWSANACGVDLNHQWPAGWHEEAQTSPSRPFFRHYGGEAPLTEPEARAIYTLTMKEEFSAVIAFHSQGEEIYWGYQQQEPPVSREFAHRLARASSYRAVQTADSKAGYKDWFIKEFKRPGFTVETGVGQNPLPFEASARIWLTALPLLLESLTFFDFTKERTR